MKRLERNLQKRQERKALGPTIGGQQRDMNPFTARNADADPFVLEGIRTVNYGRGVLDPTPFSDVDDDNFAMAAMTVVPEGHIPGMNGGLRQSGYDSPYPEHAVNVAPREIRPVAPAVIRNQTDLERTDVYYDGFRDSDGHEWHYPPPKNFEVERAVYDALRKEIKDRGLISVNQPKRPPLHGARKVFWNEGDPLYQLVPRSELAKIMKRGLTPPRPDSREPFNRFVTTPSAYNETWPYVAGHSSNEGASWIRVSPTPELDSVLSSLAKIKNSQRKPNPMGRIYVNEKGRSVDLTSNSIDREIVAGLFNGDPMIAKLFIPTENVEVLTQSGEWIPLIKSDLRDFGGGGDPTAAMADQKKPSRLRRMIGRVSKREERVDVTPTTAQSIDALNIPSSDPYRIGYSKNYGGDELIVSTQRMLRISHEALAGAGMWDEIHKDHYDWFAYPIDRGSAAYGETFNVAGEPLERLKNNPEFLRSIAREIEIQALALGWNLYGKKFVDAPNWEKGQDWQRAYPTRFWKFTRSAQIFGLEEEFESLLILQASLEQAGIRFNHASYWENPGTVDDVPPVSSAYPKNDRTRFPASDGNGYLFPGYGRPSGEPKYQGDDLFGGSLFPDEATRAEEERAWREYDDYSPGSDPILSDAEDLAEVLGNPDMAMEPNYPYANIDRETRELVSDDINFAVSLIADGQYLDEEKVDRAESAAKLNEYAFSIEGLSPDDVDILQNLADALEDPGLLGLPYDDGPVAPMRRRTLSEETEAQLVADWESGSSVDEIARKYGISRVSVYSYLKRNDTARQFQIRSAISDETEASIVADWESGSSVAEIARKFGIHLMTVYGVLRRNDTERQFRIRSAISDETEASIVADWESGSSVAEIARKFGIDLRTVYGILKRNDVERQLRPRPTISDETILNMVADWESGSSAREIAQKYSVTQPTVYAILRRGNAKRKIAPLHGRKLSEETEAQLVADWQDGSSVDEIARKYGISRVTVYGYLKRNDVERQLRPRPTISDETAQNASDDDPFAPMRRRMLSEETEAQLVADWESGSSAIELSEKYGLSETGIRNLLRRRGANRAFLEKNRLSEEAQTQLVADWESGLSVIELSEKYNVAQQTVYRLLKKRDANRPLAPVRYPDEERLNIAIDYESGMPIAEILEKYGVTQETVTDIAREFGIPLRLRKLSDETVRAILADYEEGYTLKAIANRHGVSTTTVGQIARRHFKTPRGPEKTKLDHYGIAKDYRSGMPITEIMEKYGVSSGVVNYAAKKYGLQPRLTQITEKQIEEINRRHKEGMTIREIAEKMNMDWRKVYRVLKRNSPAPTASAKKRTRKLSDEGVVERAGLGDLLDNEDPAATMAKGIVSRATDEEKQLRMRSSLPGVSARSDSRNGVMKPYLLGEPGIPEKTDLRIPDFVAATRDAGLGAYAVEGTKIAKVQGPIVSDFADRLIGPKIVSDAVATVFPSASQLFEIYAVNALLRARAEFLAGGELTADFVNEAILVGRPRFGRNQAGGFFWTPSDPSDSEKYEISPVDADNTIGAAGFGVLDPHHAFRPSDFITEVIRRMPQAVKDLLTVEAFKRQPTVRDSGIFGKPIIREDDDSSRRIAPLIREQIRVAEEHAVLQDEFAEKWARTAYELMREAGMSDAEIAGTIERHWYVTGGTDLTNVEYNKSKGLSTIDAAFDVALRTVAARFAPILPRGAIEDYPLHEFFHHYLGQGFTRHGEYSGFRGPAEMIGSFHGHLQEMLNTQLNKFVISVFGEHFDYSDMPRDLLMRKIVDEIRRRVDKMLDGSDAERGIVELVFPELMTASSQERAIIRQLISNQFAPNATGRYEFGKFAPPVLRLLTAHGLLVPLEFYPFGDNGRLIDAPPKRTYG